MYKGMAGPLEQSFVNKTDDSHSWLAWENEIFIWENFNGQQCNIVDTEKRIKHTAAGLQERDYLKQTETIKLQLDVVHDD